MRLSRSLHAPYASSLLTRLGGVAPFEHRGEVGDRGLAHLQARRARGAADVRREHHVGEREVARRSACGSPSKTSRPAPAMRLAFSASTSAASSTTPPRAVFTRIAVGFIFAISAAPMRWCMAGEYGTITTTKSASREQPVALHPRGVEPPLVGLRDAAAVVVEHAHVEARGAPRDRLADAAHADDAERGVVDVGAEEGLHREGDLPVAAAHVARRLRRCGAPRPSAAPR